MVLMRAEGSGIAEVGLSNSLPMGLCQTSEEAFDASSRNAEWEFNVSQNLAIRAT